MEMTEKSVGIHIILYGLWLVESMDAEELQIWRTYMQINLSVVQGLAVCVHAQSGEHQAPLSVRFTRQE